MQSASAPNDHDAFHHYYETERAELLAMLEPESRPTLVLEVGCGAGANLAAIKRRFPECRTIGLEMNEFAANAARETASADEVLIGDALDPRVASFPNSSFDVIVFSHVLEHFAQPEHVLSRYKAFLRPNGQMLIALPNIRHVSILKQLMFDGDFRYEDHGILDRTHLRFFTRSSAIRFLNACGLHVVRSQPEFQGRRSLLLNRLSLGFAKEFAAFAYNFLAVDGRHHSAVRPSN